MDRKQNFRIQFPRQIVVEATHQHLHHLHERNFHWCSEFSVFLILDFSQTEYCQRSCSALVQPRSYEWCWQSWV